MLAILALVHLTATLFMTGVIWFVQAVHYPLFEKVGQSEFARYEGAHAQRTTWIVAPPMLIELATSFLLAVNPPPNVPAWATWSGAGMTAALWLSTAFLQVPQHNILGGGYDPTAHRFLVTSNWLRTMLWTARSGLALWIVAALMQRP